MSQDKRLKKIEVLANNSLLTRDPKDYEYNLWEILALAKGVNMPEEHLEYMSEEDS